MSDNPAQQVRIGEMFTAVARAIRAAPLVFLIAWLVRLALDALVPVLREQGLLRMSSGSWMFVLRCVSGVGVALVSGLLIRWLLEPKRDSLRPNVGLAVYVTLIFASLVPNWLLTLLIEPNTVSLETRLGLSLAATLAGGLVMAAFALWPIALMMGDRVTPLRAVQLMAPVYWLWILALLILVLPGVGWVLISNLLHQTPLSLGNTVGRVAVNALTSTIATFVLAYIYARRVRGEDLPGTSSIHDTQEAA
jgi:hypothetical protein